jgi:NhaP-type Na+/H+ or K+/H+ antiporter
LSTTVTPAAGQGLSLADPYAVGLAFLGVALVAAIAALSRQRERPFSASMLYLALGLAAAFALDVFGVRWLDPIADAQLFERLTELAVIVALFTTGLRIDRQLSWGSWSSVTRLLVLVMPLSIAAVAGLSHLLLGLPLGAAIVLGAVLAPTDPVLAADVGLGPPGSAERPEPNFSLTGEAGLNDGLAFPFVLLGLFVADGASSSWWPTWLGADVLWAIPAGMLLGTGGGYGAAALARVLRQRELLTPSFDGWLAVAIVLVVYGAAESAGTYGFLSVFAAGMAFRRYERTHEYNRRVHDSAEVVEKFAELLVVLLIGSVITTTRLGEPGLAGWIVALALIMAIRPLVVLLSFAGSNVARRERAFVGWFGVRGIGSLYYASFAVGTGILGAADARTVMWTAIVCVLCSIAVHGVTADPVSRRLLKTPRMGRPAGRL